MEKKCLVCKKTIIKKAVTSLKEWNEQTKFCSMKCFYTSRKGYIPWNKGVKGVQVAWNRGVPNPNIKGKNNPAWRGGVTPENEKIRKCTQYKDWRQKVFIRDDFTCQSCSKRGGILNADHIKPFAYYPKLRFELSNGRTLCVDCHRSTESWGFKGIPKAERGQISFL